jgi:plastocyanin
MVAALGAVESILWCTVKNRVQRGSTNNSEQEDQPGRDKTMTKKTLWMASLPAPVLIAMLLLLPGSRSLAANDQSSAANAAVNIDNFVFGPQTITVPVGTTVTWTNKDDIPHTSVSTEGVFKSKVLDTDENFSYTFTKPGTYPYYCTIHPKMTGKVVVQ